MRLPVSVLATTALLMTSAMGHQTFLQPKTFVWSAGETIEVVMTSALSYPDLLAGPSVDRIAFASVNVAGILVDDLSYEKNETFLKIAFTAKNKGAAVMALSSKIRAGEIEPKDVEMYLDEIGADDNVRRAFLDLPGNPPLSRSYRKHAKTFFCIGTCDIGREVLSKPVGQALEFIAVSDDRRAYRVLLEGKPLARHDVLIVDMDSTAKESKSDDNGIVRLDTALSGPVMLMAVWITVPDQPDGTYHSDYATLTIDLPTANSVPHHKH